MHDDGNPTMKHKLLRMTQDWSPLEGLLIWPVDEENKAMLLDRSPNLTNQYP